MNKFVLLVLAAVAASCNFASAQTLKEDCDKLYQHFISMQSMIVDNAPECYKIMVEQAFPNGLEEDWKENMGRLIEIFKGTGAMKQATCYLDNFSTAVSIGMKVGKAIMETPSQVEEKCKEKVIEMGLLMMQMSGFENTVGNIL